MLSLTHSPPFPSVQGKLTTSKSLSNPLTKVAAGAIAGAGAAVSTIPKSLSTTAIEDEESKRRKAEVLAEGSVAAVDVEEQDEEDLNNNITIGDSGGGGRGTDANARNENG